MQPEPRLALVWTALLGALLAALPARATTYYVASNGDDGVPGTSPASAWRTLARASHAPLGPGDQLLFRAGDRFPGQLVVAASGAPGQPLRIGRYGNGPPPLLDGDGHIATILIRNQQQIEISDLAIRNDGSQTLPGTPADQRYGIAIINDGGGELRHLALQRLSIADVFAQRFNDADEEAFNRISISAIRIASLRSPAGTTGRFRDIVIARNAITRSGRFGVQITHPGQGGGPQDAHSRDPDTGFNHDILIIDNEFSQLGGSGVQLTGAMGALIENNDFLATGASLLPDRMVGRGSGAWVMNCRDVVAQHNRSRHVRGYKDSYGLHVDHGNLNILYQYNYSEDSEGGFVEILGNNRNIIWRYNISVNDGVREKAGNIFWFSPFSPRGVPSAGIHIYNNSIFVRAGLFPDIDLRAHDAVIANNILVAAPHAMIGEQQRIEMAGGQPVVAGNLVSGSVTPLLGAGGRQGDPRFMQPGATSPDGYRLRPGSPALAGGAPVVHPPFPAAGTGVLASVSAIPTIDFFGTPLPAGGTGVGAAVTVVPD